MDEPHILQKELHQTSGLKFRCELVLLFMSILGKVALQR